MDIPSPQQLARQLLERPAGNEQTLEHWLEHAFPKAREYAMEACQVNSRRERNRIADTLGIEGMRSELGTAAFEAAYQQALAAVPRASDDPALYKALNHITIARSSYHHWQDLAVALEYDILPALRALRDGSAKPAVTNDAAEDMFLAGSVMTQLLEKMPMKLQPHDADQVYSMFKDDMLNLRRSLRIKEATDRVGKTHVENLQMQGYANQLRRF